MSKRRKSRKAARRDSTERSRNPFSVYRRKLQYELLEDRRLLAVVTVTTVADTTDIGDGLTSLREAIVATNTAPGPDTIEFAPALTAGAPATILLTHGELKITDTLSIAGPGANLLKIDASGSDPTPTKINGDGARIFSIDDGTANVMVVSISGLTLTGGQTMSNGGAILTSESLTITDTTIDKNYCLTATSSGGGVAAILRDGADFTMSRSIISNNQSYTRGGGVFLDIAANSAVQISESEIFGNGMQKSDNLDQGGGIYISNQLGSVNISDCEIHDNTSRGSGGGIASNGDVTVQRSSIKYNSAATTGGGIQQGNNSLVSGNALTLIDSTVSNNSASTGGGIRLGRTAATPHTLTRSIISANETVSGGSTGNAPGGVGGGVYLENGALQVIDSTFEENTARFSGGAIYQGGSFTPGFLIKGSTISNNSAGTGGGLYASFSATIYLSTVTENVASSKGGGVFINREVLRLDNSILANNDSIVTAGDIARLANATVSAFNSLVGDNNGSGLAEAPIGAPDINGNLIGGSINGVIDPLLRPLADYGGPMPTHALAPGSPAINAGNPSLQAGVNDVPLFDQRNAPFNRVVGGRIDIGAFEFQGLPASNLVVDILEDESDSNYAPGDLSLREAIQLTNLAPDANTIQFSPTLTAGGPATILLILGQLRIVGDIAIDGPGANLLTIDASGNDPTPNVNDGLGTSIFEISDGRDELLNTSLSGLTLTGGDTQYGGAIVSTENLTITGSRISGNYASELGGGVLGVYGNLEISNCIISDNESADNGGGIAVSEAEVLITNSAISGNLAHVGGGIHAYGSELTLVNSEVTDNSALDSNSSGGGVFHKVGILSITGSIISGNTADFGGGIYSDGEAHVVNSSISGNTAGIRGGGLYARGSLEVRGTTISNNSAAFDGGGVWGHADTVINNSTLAGNMAGRSGGGVWMDLPELAATINNTTISGNSAAQDGGGVFVVSGALALDHTLIALNSAPVDADISGSVEATISARYSLLGTNEGSGLEEASVGLPDAKGNLVGGSAHGLIDPLLGPLANNSGFTLPDGSHILTRALLVGSPAINAGDLNAVAGANGVPLYDQRGEPFGRVFNGRIDIGAFEYQQASDLNLLVDTLVDESDGNYSRGDLSLREAIGLANQWPGTDAIHFDPALVADGPVTILLKLGDLKIGSSMTITGPGADLLTIDASGNDPTPILNNGDGSRVFTLTTQSTVTISALTLTGGDAGTSGGAISNARANLTVLNSQITGNNAGTGGGAIDSATGKLVVDGCTITGNSAGKNGGAIRAAGTVNIVRSRVNDNSAVSGGGIRLDSGSATITDSSIDQNLAIVGGGISTYFGTKLTITSSSVSGNTVDGVNFRLGGGLYLRGDATISSSTISNNFAPRGLGAAIWNAGISTSVTITNSTISGNMTRVGGGAIYTFSPLQLRNSTITKNTDGLIAGQASVNVTSSIVAGNENSDVTFAGSGNTFFSNGYNVVGVGNGTAAFVKPGDQVGITDPMLGPLANNGGPTLTHALLSGSPAINTGNPTAVAGVNGVPLNDQRGAPFIRIYGGRIDVGAFELQPTDYILGDFNRDGAVDAADYTLLRKQMGLSVTPGTGADANGDGLVNDADAKVWRANFGQTLPPLTLATRPSLQFGLDGRTAGFPAAESATSASASAGSRSKPSDEVPDLLSLLSKKGDSLRPRNRTAPIMSRSLTPGEHASRIDNAIDAWVASLSTTERRRMRDSVAGRTGYADWLHDVGQAPASLDVAVDEAVTTLPRNGNVARRL